MSEPLIRLHKLCKIYGQAGATQNSDEPNSAQVIALDNIDLEISAGEYLAIIGPSGSGKSTLLQMLGLLDRPSRGEYWFDASNTATMSSNELSDLRSRRIGFIFQSFNLLNNSTAQYNVELPLIYAGISGRRERAQQLLSKVGLAPRLDHLPGQLSGGQQQRVAVARALANHPAVIFADEPTGNLNQESAHEIMQILADLHKQGLTLVVVTHDPQIAAQARRVITIVDGKIQSDTLTAQHAPPAQAADAAPNPELVAASLREAFTQLENPRSSEWGIAFENFAMAIKSLGANKRRTALSALGILIGVASVITMMALGQGARQSIADELTRLGSNLLTIRSGNNKIILHGGRRSNPLSLADSNALNDLREVGVPLTRVEASVSGSVQTSRGAIKATSKVQGVTSEYPKLYAANPTLGKFFSREDDQSRRRVCVLGQTVFRTLFSDNENPVGSEIKINHLSFLVLGVLPSKGSSAFGDRDDIIAVPLQTAMHRLLGKTQVDQIAVEVARYEDIPLAMDSIEGLLRRRHGLGPSKENDFTLRNMADIQETLSSTTKTMTVLLGLIASISLLVGGIGIMNIMLVSVKERTREIGLRKALGAKNRHLLMQFLIEAVIISMLGGSAGVLLGVGASLGITATLGWLVIIPPAAVLGSLFFSTAIGVIFGFWPARQASELSPMEALRYQ